MSGVRLASVLFPLETVPQNVDCPIFTEAGRAKWLLLKLTWTWVLSSGVSDFRNWAPKPSYLVPLWEDAREAEW